MLDDETNRRQQFAHGGDVFNIGHIRQHEVAISHEASGHELQNRVFGPGYVDSAAQWRTGSHLDACTV